MKNLSIKNIIEVTKGKLIVGNEENICKTYSKDTREIKNGNCYIGIKGEKFDGNKFWETALENGAETVIVQDVDFAEKDIEKYLYTKGQPDPDLLIRTSGEKRLSSFLPLQNIKEVYTISQ